MMGEDYVCNLTEASLKVAVDELNEDPKERLSQVETLRTWVKQQKHLTAPTDTRFLLKFLRTAKFSQLRAREVLENYLKVKTRHSEWLSDVDLGDPKILEYFKTGTFMMLPKRDPKGRIICFSDPGRMDYDPKKWDKDIVVKALFGLNNLYTIDENDLVNGIVFFQDFTDFSMKVMTFWGLETIAKTTKLWQGNFPGRFKSFHYYNTGVVFEKLMSVMMPLMSKKFRDRIIIHGKNMEEVYKHVPKECLPQEYLPDDYSGPHQGNIQEIIDQMVARMTSPEVRNRILHETSSKWKYDFKLKPDDIPNESFRKLNVD